MSEGISNVRVWGEKVYQKGELMSTPKSKKIVKIDIENRMVICKPEDVIVIFTDVSFYCPNCGSNETYHMGEDKPYKCQQCETLFRLCRFCDDSEEKKENEEERHS